MKEKMKLFYESLKVILSEEMDTDNCEVINCEDDGDYTVFCNFCDKLCIERFHENHLKSPTHINSIRKRQQIK